MENHSIGVPSFIDRILPAPKNGGFRMEGYWVWCGSVIRGEDGTYHMFASRWPKELPFHPHWCTQSEVVRAVSKDPQGPYQFEEVVLPPRGPQFWDGRTTHNPTIHKYGDTYLLFYTGTTYDESIPTKENPAGDALWKISRANQRIGLAAAKSVRGPWRRRDVPILQPREGAWDAFMTTNAAPCITRDGRIYLAYKSTAHHQDVLRYGMAMAESIDSPFRRLRDQPIFNFEATQVEDAYLWQQDDRFEMLLKDMTGNICGEARAGFHAHSQNAIEWTVFDPPKAYSRTIRWDDGTVTTQHSLERPQLLIEDGVPTHLFAATADGAWNAPGTKTWNMVLPLKR